VTSDSGAGVTTAETYAEFAARETRGVSPSYERLSTAVSRDGEVLDLLGTLPPAKRQPNLLFGVVRWLGGPVEDPVAFHDYAVTNWPAIQAQMRCWTWARPPGCACTPTGTRTATATTRSVPAFRSCPATPPGWRRPPAGPRWCGGPAWTSTRST